MYCLVLAASGNPKFLYVWGAKERIQVCSLMNTRKGKSGLKGAPLKTQSTY